MCVTDNRNSDYKSKTWLLFKLLCHCHCQTCIKLVVYAVILIYDMMSRIRVISGLERHLKAVWSLIWLQYASTRSPLMRVLMVMNACTDWGQTDLDVEFETEASQTRPKRSMMPQQMDQNILIVMSGMKLDRRFMAMAHVSYERLICQYKSPAPCTDGAIIISDPFFNQLDSWFKDKTQPKSLAINSLLIKGWNLSV